MKILGIETSCDETSAAVVNSDKKILSNIVLSQIKEHESYGGVVPEIAARSHLQNINPVIQQALEEAGVDFGDIDAVACTAGPGLIGGLIVGVITAKSIASVIEKPCVAVNHLAGHALTARLVNDIEFPYLLLLVSGGHCQIMVARNATNYETLGSTLDDAIGESFDKVAKLIGLGYPGGPAVEKYAAEGDTEDGTVRFDFPRPMMGRKGCDFSFSGLKTAVRNQVAKLGNPGHISEQDKADICASFQQACADILCDRIENAIEIYQEKISGGSDESSKNLVIAGGVAANKYLRSKLTGLSEKHEFNLVSPPIELCTDNAAMIAWAGIEMLNQGYAGDLNFAPKARWEL